MQIYAQDGRPLPLITPVAQPFFEAARKGKFLLQKCPRDGFFFYPRSHCPHCLGSDWAWLPARNIGRIYAFTIDRMGHDPGLRSRIPFVIAVVELDDGPRIIGNISGIALEQLHAGQSVCVAFEIVDGRPLIVFHAAS